MIRLESVTKTYQTGTSSAAALKPINLDLKKHDFLILTGRSGSGKTTLLNIMGALESPDSGKIFFEDQEITKLNDEELSYFRRKKIGFIFQTFNLIPVLSAFENVEYPLVLLKMPIDQRRKKVNDLMELVGLQSQKNLRPAQMSGGQRQRVAIARALVKQPELILADEPTANLDAQTAQEILSIIENLYQQVKGTVVLCTHDLSHKKMGNRHIELSDGEIKVDSKL